MSDSRNYNWNTDDLIETLNSGSVEDDIEFLKKAGILTDDLKLSPLYKNYDKDIHIHSESEK